MLPQFSMVYKRFQTSPLRILVMSPKSQRAVLITALEGLASAGKMLKTVATPSLPLKVLDLFPAWCSSGSFEHLEDTESSFEEDSETNLLIKGKSSFSATRLCSHQREKVTRGLRRGELCFSLVSHSLRMVTSPETRGRKPQEGGTDCRSPQLPSQL